VIDHPASHGISLTNCPLFASHLTVYAGGDGIYFSAINGGSFIWQSIVSNSGTIGINNASATNSIRIRAIGTDFYLNGGGNLAFFTEQADYNSDLQVAFGAKQETASPFKALGTDYSLQYNSLAMGSAFPGIFENVTLNQGYSSPGAITPPVDGWKVISQNHQDLGLFVAGVGLLGLGIISVALRSR
jgi:hypothetical protein